MPKIWGDFFPEGRLILIRSISERKGNRTKSWKRVRKSRSWKKATCGIYPIQRNVKIKGSKNICMWKWIRKPVFRIRGILVSQIRMRIRILGSVPLTNGSGSCSFRQWLRDVKKKFTNFLCSFIIEGTFTVHLHHSSKIKKSQTSKNQHFFHFFACWWRDPNPCIWITDPDADPGGPKTTNPTGGTLPDTTFFLVSTGKHV